MIPKLRDKFNSEFTKEAYQSFLEELQTPHPGAIEFRIAETVIFVPKAFTKQMLDACEAIIDIITASDFIQKTERATPPEYRVAGDAGNSDFIAFDFGVCINDTGEYEPQLIEMQGFPTLFAFEVLMDDVYRKHFPIPENFSCYLNGLDRNSYIELLKEIIIGNDAAENVILLELFPHKQKTRIDFYCTEDYLNIKTVCLTELIQEGNKLFYLNAGNKTEIKRIYNRIIFDDLQQQTDDIKEKGKIFFENLDVKWIPHPDWFYRISKYTLPFIKHPNVPPTFFLNELETIPTDLENYVLKPLFSFAGQGVVIDVLKSDIAQIKDPENWILQKKVKYADVIKTPDIPAKAEIRLFYFWKQGATRPIPTNNLARLSKGKMIGVRYNQDKEWVGGSFCVFEK